MVMCGESGCVLASGVCGLSAIKVPLKGRLFRLQRSLGGPGSQSTALSQATAMAWVDIALERVLRQILTRWCPDCAKPRPSIATLGGHARINTDHGNFQPAGQTRPGRGSVRGRHGDPQPD